MAIDPAVGRIVADADVLAADLLVDGPARDALDLIRSHTWLTLLASPRLLDDTTHCIASLTGPDLADTWHHKITSLATLVDHPPDDHPALATAHHGNARHILTFDDNLRTAQTGAAIREHLETSIKHPHAFTTLFDPETLYPMIVGGTYPGPDHDPRT